MEAPAAPAAEAAIPANAAEAAAATAAAPRRTTPQQIETEDQTEEDGVVVFLVKWTGIDEPSWIEANAARQRADFAPALEEWEVAKASGLAQGQLASGDSDEEEEEEESDEEGVFCDSCAERTTGTEQEPIVGRYHSRREGASSTAAPPPPRYEDLCPSCFDSLNPAQRANYEPVESEEDDDGDSDGGDDDEEEQQEEGEGQAQLMALIMGAVHSEQELGEVAAAAAASVREDGGETEEQVAVSSLS